MAFPKFQTKEVLNKVLNSGEDALNVDLADSVTVTVDSEFPPAVTITDNFGNPDTTSVMSMLMGWDGTYWDRVTIGGGTEATALRVTIASNSTGVVTVDGTVSVSGLLADGHNVTIDNASDDEVYVRGSGSAGSPDAGVLTVQGIGSGTAQPVSGTFWQSTQPVSLASVPTHAVTISDISFAVADGNALGEGVLVQGDDGSDRKNIHVDATTGDVQVDVTDIVPGVAAASLGKAEDAEHGSGDTGVAVLAVRNDVLEALAGTDGDYSVLQVNKTGALNVTETVGHLGAHYESGTTANSGLKIVAFQFLEDTKFSVLTPATSAYIGNTSSGGDDVASGDVFPQGMTIFGRWTAFTLVSGGRVIAYNGDW